MHEVLGRLVILTVAVSVLAFVGLVLWTAHELPDVPDVPQEGS